MPDFAVSHVMPQGEQRIRARTSVAGDTLEPWDIRDCANPRMWVLGSGTPAPRFAPPLVLSVVPLVGGTTAVDDFALELDAPLEPGAGYTLSLDVLARSYGGEATAADAVPFVGPRVAGPSDLRARTVGGDVAFPPVADGTGDLSLFDRETALRHRLSSIVLGVRKGAFRFAETADVGRGFEPKRTYSAAALAQEASRLRSVLERDPDVKIADVQATTSGHIAEFRVSVVPSFSSRKIALPKFVLAGGAS